MTAVRPKAMLDLGTGCLSEEDIHCLEVLCQEYTKEWSGKRPKPVPFRVLDNEYGFVVFVNEDLEEVKKECSDQRIHLSDNFWRQYRYATSVEAMIINYDADAENYSCFDPQGAGDA